MKIWEPKSPGALWATPGLLRDCFTSTLLRYLYVTLMSVAVESQEEKTLYQHEEEDVKIYEF